MMMFPLIFMPLNRPGATQNCIERVSTVSCKESSLVDLVLSHLITRGGLSVGNHDVACRLGSGSRDPGSQVERIVKAHKAGQGSRMASRPCRRWLSRSLRLRLGCGWAGFPHLVLAFAGRQVILHVMAHVMEREQLS